jgi:hypothetical protein
MIDVPWYLEDADHEQEHEHDYEGKNRDMLFLPRSDIDSG